jgi:hypothetical protein
MSIVIGLITDNEIILTCYTNDITIAMQYLKLKIYLFSVERPGDNA